MMKSVQDRILDLLVENEAKVEFVEEACCPCPYFNPDTLDCECPCIEACPWYGDF